MNIYVTLRRVTDACRPPIDLLRQWSEPQSFGIQTTMYLKFLKKSSRLLERTGHFRENKAIIPTRMALARPMHKIDEICKAGYLPRGEDSLFLNLYMKSENLETKLLNAGRSHVKPRDM
jgi:hypothetical protein